MAIRKSEAIVIKHINFEDADKLVFFFTRRYGKMKAVARGGRRPRSRLGSSTEIFTYSDLVFYQKSDDEIVTISQCDIKEPFYQLREDLTKMAYGAYAAELVGEMMGENEANVGLFVLLLSFLSGLRDERDLVSLLRAFEVRFLTMVGYMPEVRKCISCGEELSATVKLSPALGGALGKNCLNKDPLAIKVSPEIIDFISRAETVDPREINTLALTSAALKANLKEALAPYIRYYLEKELKSLSFLEAVEAVTSHQ